MNLAKDIVRKIFPNYRFSITLTKLTYFVNISSQGFYGPMVKHGEKWDAVHWPLWGMGKRACEDKITEELSISYWGFEEIQRYSMVYFVKNKINLYSINGNVFLFKYFTF